MNCGGPVAGPSLVSVFEAHSTPSQILPSSFSRRGDSLFICRSCMLCGCYMDDIWMIYVDMWMIRGCYVDDIWMICV